MASDKYPADSDRRRFVKGVVGGATLGAVGSTSAAGVSSVTRPTGAGGGQTTYYGVESVRGPAPRAMPQIPLEIDDEGFLRGVFPDDPTQIGGVEYRPEWFQYCGVQTYPGVQPGADQDDYFRYSIPPEAGLPGLDWMREHEGVEPGARMHVDHFEDYESWGNGVGQAGLGKPARGTWRSEGVESSGTMPVEVVRSPRVEELADRGGWLQAATQDGFVAYLDKCTHFCCVPSFKGIPGAAKEDAEDQIYCPCHQSVYDPFSIVRRQFVALPRSDD